MNRTRPDAWFDTGAPARPPDGEAVEPVEWSLAMGSTLSGDMSTGNGDLEPPRLPDAAAATHRQPSEISQERMEILNVAP